MKQDSRSPVIFSLLEDVSCVICLNSSVKKTDGSEHRCMGEGRSDTVKKYIKRGRKREGRREEFIAEGKRMRSGIMCKNLFP